MRVTGDERRELGKPQDGEDGPRCINMVLYLHLEYQAPQTYQACQACQAVTDAQSTGVDAM